MENRPETRSDRIWRYLGNSMAIIIYAFLVMPSLIVVPLSFGDSQEIIFPPENWSLSLYREFFTDSQWLGSALQSVMVASGSAVLAMIFGIPASYALVRGNFRITRYLNMIVISPMLVPVVVLGLGYFLYFSQMRIQGTTLGLILAHTVFVVPFVILAVSAGLRQIDPALEKAAMIMGASQARIFTGVVLPQLKAPLLVAALFAFMISFDEVVIAYFISDADTSTLPVHMYSAIKWEISPVIAAAATLWTMLSLVVCLLVICLEKPHKNQGV